MATWRRWRRRSRPRRDSCSPRRSPTRWSARRISTRCASVIARRASDRAGAAARARHHDRLAVGVQRPAARQRRRHRRRQRHQVARRQRSRHVGLHRDQRHAVRQLGDGSDRHARRHPRLAAGRGGRVGVRRRRANRMRGDRRRRRRSRRSSAAHPKVSEVFHPSLPNHPDRRGDRQALRASRIAAVVPHRRTPTKIARAISPTCSRRP